MDPLIEAAHRRQRIRSREDVGALRRQIAATGAVLPIRTGDAELVATELATNILKHGGGEGHVLYRPIPGGIEFVATDRGPGFRGHDSASALMLERQPALPEPRPGGGLGVGLGAVVRLARTVDLYSTEGRGTTLLARLIEGRPGGAAGFRWGGVNVPVGGDGVSGDAWAVRCDGRVSAMVVDGLGHGRAAHEAAEAAVRIFHEDPVADLADFVGRANEAMLGTRGGVLGRCEIDPATDRLVYVGVGNVSGRVLRGRDEHGLLTRDGSLGTGRAVRRAVPVEERWGSGAVLLLASDGLDPRWRFSDYPGLIGHDPTLVAATIERDHGRDGDDVTVLVVRDCRGAAA